MHQLNDPDAQLSLFDDEIFAEPARPPLRRVLGITEAGWFWLGYTALFIAFTSTVIYHW